MAKLGAKGASVGELKVAVLVVLVGGGGVGGVGVGRVGGGPSYRRPGGRGAVGEHGQGVVVRHHASHPPHTAPCLSPSS